MLDAFLFSVEAVLPLVLMVAVGYALKKCKLCNESFAKQANKLVFRIFLPCMLFLNIYEIELDTLQFDPTYLFYVAGAVLLVFFIAIFTAPLFTKQAPRRAPLMQAVFRSNYALIGIPLAAAIGGVEGSIASSILTAVTVPMFNILAVIVFSVYAAGEKKPSIRQTLLEILKNPLNLGVAAGLLGLLLKKLLFDAGIFATLADIAVLYKPLSYLRSLATPMALLMLGVQFTFSALPSMKKELLYGVLARLVAVPALVISAAAALNCFTPAHMASFIGAFATPVAVSTVPMTQELGGDSELAGQLVVWSTLLSGVTIFLLTFLLKSCGLL